MWMCHDCDCQYLLYCSLYIRVYIGMIVREIKSQHTGRGSLEEFFGWYQVLSPDPDERNEKGEL